nr:MAG TPA: hypothetical protein [Caudoviricetes sp.]
MVIHLAGLLSMVGFISPGSPVHQHTLAGCRTHRNHTLRLLWRSSGPPTRLHLRLPAVRFHQRSQRSRPAFQPQRHKSQPVIRNHQAAMPISILRLDSIIVLCSQSIQRNLHPLWLQQFHRCLQQNLLGSSLNGLHHLIIRVIIKDVIQIIMLHLINGEAHSRHKVTHQCFHIAKYLMSLKINVNTQFLSLGLHAGRRFQSPGVNLKLLRKIVLGLRDIVETKHIWVLHLIHTIHRLSSLLLRFFRLTFVDDSPLLRQRMFPDSLSHLLVVSHVTVHAYPTGFKLHILDQSATQSHRKDEHAVCYKSIHIFSVYGFSGIARLLKPQLSHHFI